MRIFYSALHTKPADGGDALCVIFLCSLPPAFFFFESGRKTFKLKAAALQSVASVVHAVSG